MRNIIFLKKLKNYTFSNWFLCQTEINKATARTLTATMVKMHRAGQDNYFSDEYIDSTIKEAKQYENFVVPKNKYSKYNIRKITPLEGLLYKGLISHFTNLLENLKSVIHSYINK